MSVCAVTSWGRGRPETITPEAVAPTTQAVAHVRVCRGWGRGRLKDDHHP